MRFCLSLLTLLLILVTGPASAKVQLSFYSYKGAILAGRYPHGFVMVQGTQDTDGQSVDETFGYSTSAGEFAVLSGPTQGVLDVPTPAYIAASTRHVSITITDEQWRAIRAEKARWIDPPGQFHYELYRNNCVNFLARIAQIAGLELPVPPALELKPRAYLTLLAARYPQAQAAQTVLAHQP